MIHEIISKRTSEKLNISEDLVNFVVKNAQWSIIKNKLDDYTSIELTGLGYFTLRNKKIIELLRGKMFALRKAINEKKSINRLNTLEEDIVNLRKKLVQYYESETYTRRLEKRSNTTRES